MDETQSDSSPATSAPIAVASSAKKTRSTKKKVAKRKAAAVSSSRAPSDNGPLGRYGFYFVIALALFILYNQVQIMSLTSLGASSGSSSLAAGDVDLTKVKVEEIRSTAQGIAVLFPVGDIKTSQDAINVMIPTGTPDYGAAMGVSYDDPVPSMEKMARAYRALNEQIKQNPEQWQRYLDLASEPRGVSCEFCCGVGPAGVTKDGQSKCGCQHHPAVLSLTIWLIQNTEYSDAQILREVYRWKSLFFPKNMVGLASQIAGGDASVLEDLPGMVGGC
jgi:hypothetical protein